MPGALLRIAAAAGAIACVSAAVVASSAGPAAAAQAIRVTSLSSSGPGSLRAAIDKANSGLAGTPAVIAFSVRGTIFLDRDLPAISSQVVIDGESAPTFVTGGPPAVEVDCSGHGGLQFAAGSDGSQLLGVAVDGASGSGVTLTAGHITVNYDYIGLDLNGAPDGNDGDGVHAEPGSSGNLIGLNRTGISGAVTNVISANGGSGIALTGSSGNTVVANRIGTNVAGTVAIPNGGDGISITGRSNGNEIGGTAFVDRATGQANNPTGSEGTVTPVFVVPPLGNLISGNHRNGVLIASGSQGNVLNGNFIGTTAEGDAGLANAANGVWIHGANGNSLVGCKFVNNPFVYYNVVSGNHRNGLRITSSDNSVVQGNFFGIGADNTATVRNLGDGILVDGTAANTQVGGVIPLGNVSSGNGLNGVEVAGQATGFTTFNTFAGLLAFKGAAPNQNDGLRITSTGGNNLARTNVFSGNNNNGIELAGRASGVTIDPDIAGLNTDGSAALPNGGDGLLIDDRAHDNTIGGSLASVIQQDTFSGNLGYGIAITGGAYRNRVFTSFIGTNLKGLKPLANQQGGVLVAGTAHRNAIGLLTSRPPSNIISGNLGNGVTLLAGTRRNQVFSNFIGLDRLGRKLPNTGRPIVNRGFRNVIFANSSN
jgi:parallel beta-helix repeat protein